MARPPAERAQRDPGDRAIQFHSGRNWMARIKRAMTI